MYAYTRHSTCLLLSAHQVPHGHLQWVRVVSTRTRLLTFLYLELDLLDFLRPVFLCGAILSLMLDSVVSPEEEDYRHCS
jgi:hypothetical protein